MVRGLGRRALMLYFAFVAVTLSVLLMSLDGSRRRPRSRHGDERGGAWFLDRANH